MNRDLATLIDLQKTMAHYDELCERARELPKQIEECQAEHQAVIVEHERLVQHYKQLQVELREAEVDLKAGEEQIVKRQVKLHEVKTNEEYKAVLHEIEVLKQKKSDTETRILELYDAVEAAKADVARSERRLAEDKQNYARRLQHLQDTLAAVQNELANFSPLVEQKRASMKPQMVALFERIYNRNAGKAVVPVIGTEKVKNCGYCQIALPPHRVQDAQEGRDLVACDHCGSILYWESEAIGTQAS